MNLDALETNWSNVDGSHIWEAFRDGSKGALGFIYQSNIKQLYNYGMQVCQISEVVEDAIQELFVDLWKNRGRLSATDNIRFYLMKGLRNKLMDFYRGKSKAMTDINSYVLQTEMEVMLPYETLLVAEQISEERKKRLFQVLAKLPPRQKEVIHLIFFEKLSYEKVSEMMAMNLRSVYTLAWKAISSIRKSPEFLVL